MYKVVYSQKLTSVLDERAEVNLSSDGLILNKVKEGHRPFRINLTSASDLSPGQRTIIMNGLILGGFGMLGRRSLYLSSSSSSTVSIRLLANLSGGTPTTNSSSTPFGNHGVAGACKWLSSSSASQVQAPMKGATTEGEDFFEKNKRLNRPVSPHLTIYQFQITNVLSLTHRATGILLSAMTSGFAIGVLFLPCPFPVYFSALQAAKLGPALIFAAKLALTSPFFYHLFNGIRHLCWDLGKGFSLKEVYATGYGVLAATIVSSIIAASL